MTFGFCVLLIMDLAEFSFEVIVVTGLSYDFDRIRTKLCLQVLMI